MFCFLIFFRKEREREGEKKRFSFIEIWTKLVVVLMMVNVVILKVS